MGGIPFTLWRKGSEVRILQLLWNFKRNIEKFFLSSSYKINSPRCTAYLWIIYSKCFIKSSAANSDSVLVLVSQGGREDIYEAYFNRIKRINSLGLDQFFVDHLFFYFFNEKFEDYDYLDKIGDFAREKELYFQYLDEMLTSLKSRGVVGIINFNFVYSAHRVLMEVASSQGIPFITVYKECLRPPIFRNAQTRMMHDKIGQIHPHAVIVHSEESREMIINSGIIAAEKVLISGQSRSTYLHRSRKIPAYSTGNLLNVLYFAIDPLAGLPYYSGKWCGEPGAEFTLDEIANRTLSTLIAFISEEKCARLIVKTKAPIYEKSTHPRMDIVSGGPSHELINNADVIVGLNTTALFEGLIQNKLVISCQFNIKGTSFPKDHTYDFLGCVNVVRKEEELITILQNYNKFDNKILKDAKKIVIDRAIFNSDGLASLRLYNFLNSFFIK